MRIPVECDVAKGHYYRGYILDEFIQLEMAINDYIVSYLLKKDGKMTFNEAFTKIQKMTFSKKGNYFGSILDILEAKNDSLITSLLSEVKLLIGIRNDFAHDYLIAVLPLENKAELGKVIYLAKFKYGFEVISYSEKELCDLFTRINNAEKKVIDFKKKLTLSNSKK